MTKKDNFIFQFIHVMTWIIFVGLCIEAGGLLVNFIFSLFKPDIVNKLYNKLDLRQMYDLNKWTYYSMYSFIIFIALTKVVLFYIAINLLYKFKLKQPFSSFVENKIRQMSYLTLFIGLLSFIGFVLVNKLLSKGFHVIELYKYFSDSQAFILMSTILYLIAFIFKKGNDLQKENDLTI